MNINIKVSMLLCAIALTACMQQSKQLEQKEEVTTGIESKTIDNNVIEFHKIANKHENSQTVFDEFIKAYDIVIVDFYATWCEPCTKFSKVVARVAPQIKDVMFLKIDVDKAKALASHFGIRGIPTVLIFKNGKEIKLTSSANRNSEQWLRDIISQARIR